LRFGSGIGSSQPAPAWTNKPAAGIHNSIKQPPPSQEGDHMKTKITLLLMTVMALFLLTAATTEQRNASAPMSDAQMLSTVGGELFNCGQTLASDVQNCQSKSNIEDCIISAGNSYLWCRVWETILFFVGFFF
jgi:hypothetical protein